MTLEARRTVEQLKFAGESEATIARALGIDPDTLRKHFGDELADGYAQRRAELIGILFDAARAGKVAAVNALDKMARAARPDGETNIS
ncbi:hypothetical protein ICN83_10560 [Sphingopyxis granuli]|nr:hypothetical protein ICN83_10560 [Sphingopyxis granuli]